MILRRSVDAEMPKKSSTTSSSSSTGKRGRQSDDTPAEAGVAEQIPSDLNTGIGESTEK